ncbi:MAG TPA: response regulator transcription factor [Blastocatellia bacterium]|nr:response regulator transcription factor [Blastocatellia bacterium]
MRAGLRDEPAGVFAAGVGGKSARKSQWIALMRVLIVENNSAMRHLLRQVIGDAAEVYECTDGAEALPLYEAHHLNGADWVLMDLRMARVNGLEATRRLRAAHEDARVLIVTSYSDARLREAARQAGACGYVLKENLHQLQELLAENSPAHCPWQCVESKRSL